MSRNDDAVTAHDLVLKIETPKAFGVESDVDEVIWLPKSQIEEHTLVIGEQGIAVMPKWLADKHEFIYDE
jgi:hypothetical protein